MTASTSPSPAAGQVLQLLNLRFLLVQGLESDLTTELDVKKQSRSGGLAISGGGGVYMNLPDLRFLSPSPSCVACLWIAPQGFSLKSNIPTGNTIPLLFQTLHHATHQTEPLWSLSLIRRMTLRSVIWMTNHLCLVWSAQ